MNEPKSKLKRVAYLIANDLFTSGGGSGRQADRLVLEYKDGGNGGGWCKQAVVDLITRYLSNTKK